MAIRVHTLIAYTLSDRFGKCSTGVILGLTNLHDLATGFQSLPGGDKNSSADYPWWHNLESPRILVY